MSERFSGGFITKTPVVPTTTSASGIWTLDQQEQAQQAGIWPQQPNPQYIEDVFSTYLTTGNSSTQTVNNGIDLAGKGGMIWFKQRNAANNNALFDTVRGTNKLLYSNTTAAQIDSVASYSDYTVTSFNSNGVTLGNDPNLQVVNTSPNTYASWTFRKQPKFFDIVTGTCDGSGNITVNHSLGSVPGFVTIKRTDGVSAWNVYHTSLGNNQYLQLNGTNAVGTLTGIWNPTSTTFTANCGFAAGAQVVLYLWAHNAGGFGPLGADNAISCGSYTGNGSTTGPDISLGYEPQLVIIKRASTGFSGNWYIADNMRGMAVNGTADSLTNVLFPNLSNAESTLGGINPTATGFQIQGASATSASLNGSGATYIYIAIRRGPMKTPTDATKVFSAALYTGTGSNNTITSPFPTDLLLVPNRAGNYFSPSAWDRLRGATNFLRTPGTDAEAVSSDGLTSFGASQNAVAVGADATYGNINFSGRNYVPYLFRRAPSFFDEVCYTGTGSAQILTHNLGTAPQLMIVKGRLYGGYDWAVYANDPNQNLYLNTTAGFAGASDTWNYSNPTATQFSVGTSPLVGASGWTYVAYLFATCAGVSKVGSYTGTGSAQIINCGFTGGARFVLIKRTDSTSGWFVFDTARGMVSGTDPYIQLNSTGAEVNSNTIFTTTGGFQIVGSGLNVSGGTYIFLAIA